LCFWPGPILLYYSYNKLARVLFLCTYQPVEAKGKHGLTLGDNEGIKVQRNGAFQRFHDTYSWEPSIYLSTCKFSWRDLINDKTGRYALVLNMSNCNAVYLHERESKNKQYLEHELSREIMFIYAMTMFARYKVQDWNRLIEARKDDIIWKINEYLTSTQTLVPNLIYNQLQGEQYYFHPVEPVTPGQSTRISLDLIKVAKLSQNSELLSCHLFLDHTCWEISTQSLKTKDWDCLDSIIMTLTENNFRIQTLA
jgi:hypothetical protein